MFYKHHSSFLSVSELSRARPPQKQAPPVAFLAVLNQHKLVNVAAKATLVFDTPVTNLADGYSSSDGLFTAPHGGIYLVSTYISGWDNSGWIPVKPASWSSFTDCRGVRF